MLALNISATFSGQHGQRADVRACAERWWTISDSTLATFGESVLAVAGDRVAGVFRVVSHHRDPAVGNKVAFDLVDDPSWAWLVGQPNPVPWRKGQANPVRKVPGVILDQLIHQRPQQRTDTGGWTLEVDPGGEGATVRASGRIVVTAVQADSVRLEILPASGSPSARPVGLVVPSAPTTA